MARQPIVDDLYTRRLETRDLERSTVKECEVRQQEADLETLPLWLREGAVIPLGPVMDHVDQRPLDELTLRIAPFAGDGVRELRVPTQAGDLRVAYRAAKGRHVVTTSPGAHFTLEVVGSGAPTLEHRS